MLLLLKLLNKLISTLNSAGTPGQVAMGMALGACLGLTPLINVHNALVFALAIILNVALGGFFIGWTLAVPLGFILDPLFHAIGTWLLAMPALQGLWTTLYNVPGVPLTNFNNSVVLGSLVFWVVVLYPLFLVLRYLIAKYREHVYARLKRMHFFQVLSASKVAQVYRWFTPGPS